MVPNIDIKKIKEYIEKHGIEVLTVSTSATLILMVFYGSAIAANAAILAVVTTAGILFFAIKLPTHIQKFLVKHALITDTAAGILTYWMLGKTVTSLLAAGLVGITTSVLIWTVKPLFFQEEISVLVEKA